MQKYLQKRRRRWYAILEIPAALRPIIGKPRFIRSLETESFDAASRRVGVIVAAWRAEIEKARSTKSHEAQDDAAFFRKALREAGTDAQRNAILEQIAARADDIGALAVEHIGQAPSTAPEAQQFYGEATGALVATAEHLDEWMSTVTVRPKTMDVIRSDVVRFAAKFPMVRDVDRASVRRWVTALTTGPDAMAPKSVQRSLSGVRGYWRYMQAIGAVADDNEPFDKLRFSGASDGPARQPFDGADLPKLIQAALANDDEELADLIRLGMWTGCRIAELCALKIMDVALGNASFRVVAGKSEAAVRVVPVHPELAPVLARLIGSRVEGFVLHGLSPDKYGNRSGVIGKRFGSLRTAAGFGPEFVYHSIRKCVVTILENAGVPENVVADIVGHNKPRITYGLYSGGTSLEVKRSAIEKLTYPLA